MDSHPLEQVRVAALSGVPDNDLAMLASAATRDGAPLEQVIIEALQSSRRLDRDEQRVLIRWYRRAAELDQPWALWRGGERWSLFGSNGSLPWKEALPESEAVSPKEAIGWLQRAADHGVRPAAMSAAETAPHDPRAVDWLRLAYGDGRPTDDIDRGRLLDAAFMLASCLSESRDAEAQQWFRKAVECGPWENRSPFRESSWEESVAAYAFWAHSSKQDDALCAAWCWRLVENAANQGPGARSFMHAEHKIYRSDWQTTKGQESARVHVMRHLLSEHDLGAEAAWDVALLLADHRWLDEGDAELLTDTLGVDLNGLSLAELSPQDSEAQEPTNDASLNRRQAWALTHWVFADAIPATFRFAGLAEAADTFATAVPAFPPEEPTHELKERLSSFAGWDQLETSAADGTTNELDAYISGQMAVSYRAHKEALRLAEDVLCAAGLEGRRSPLATDPDAQVDDNVYEGGKGKWRLLRGRRLWLGMYLTMDPVERDAWVDVWEVAGLLLMRALSASVRRVAEDMDVDLASHSLLNSDIRARYQTLAHAYALSMRDFVESAASLR